jgi:hypothetical protein
LRAQRLSSAQGLSAEDWPFSCRANPV